MFNAPASANMLSRRQVLKSAGAGFGYLALAGLLGQNASAQTRRSKGTGRFSTTIRTRRPAPRNVSPVDATIPLSEMPLAAQEQAASTVVEGVAGGGAVRVAVTGAFEFQSVTISPEAVDPDDVEMLQDLVLAALRDAVDEIQGLTQGGLDLGGMGLDGLLGGS